MLFFFDAQIAISLGFYLELMHFLESFGGLFPTVYKPTCSKTHFGVPGSSGGGLFVASSFWLVWGSFFLRFGRCPNHDDFLLQ